MKFYYVASKYNPFDIVGTQGGKRLAYYIKKHQAIKQMEIHNAIHNGLNSHLADKDPYKVFYVESEPKEIKK